MFEQGIISVQPPPQPKKGEAPLFCGPHTAKEVPPPPDHEWCTVALVRGTPEGSDYWCRVSSPQSTDDQDKGGILFRKRPAKEKEKKVEDAGPNGPPVDMESQQPTETSQGEGSSSSSSSSSSSLDHEVKVGLWYWMNGVCVLF